MERSTEQTRPAAALVCPQIPQTAEPVRASTLALHTQSVEQVISWMRSQLDEPMTLQAMAEVADISPYHFSRVFSRVTGISPSKYLAALRLQYAKRLLLTSQLSATAVCFEVGYSSLGTFTTQFTQTVGLSPARFRRFSEHPALSGLEALRTFRDHGLPHMLPRTGVIGQVVADVDFSGVVFIGLFNDPIPQGAPVGWTMLHEPGLFHLPTVPNGLYWLFAAAFPWSDDPLLYLLPRREAFYVGSGDGPIQVQGLRIAGSTRLVLRKLRPTDPPILSALPILLNRSLGPLPS